MATYRVDSVNGVDTPGGDATHGYATTQYCLDDNTIGAAGDTIELETNGSHGVNGLSFATFGVPTNATPVTFVGTDNAGAVDFATKGAVTCTSAAMFASNLYDGINLVNLDISAGPTGAGAIIDLDNNIEIIHCKIDGFITINNDFLVLGCELFNDANTREVFQGDRGVFCSNFLRFASTTGADIGAQFGNGSHVVANIFVYNTTTANKCVTIREGSFMQNTVYGNVATTGDGVEVLATGDQVVIWGNLFQGMSGTGSVALDQVSGGTITLYANNSYNDNTTDFSQNGDVHVSSNNEAVGSALIAESGSATTFSNRHTFYAPQDVGAVYDGGGFDTNDNRDRGAINHECAAGGSTRGLFF